AKYPITARVKGKVVNLVPYGAFVELEPGVEGLVHVTELSWTKRISKPSDMLKVDQDIEAVVLGINREEQKISLGIRQLETNPWDRALEKYLPGSRVKGKIHNLTSSFAFVELEDGLDGIIHVSDISWTRKINHPSEVLKKGEEVEAAVLEIDKANQRISLGLKQLSEDPWNNIDKYCKMGDLVTGKVTKLASFGARVGLQHDIDGLVHISQVSEERVDKIKSVLKVDQEVTARVIKIDKGERRIGLSIKAANYSQEQLKAEQAMLDSLKQGEDEDLVALQHAFDAADEAQSAAQLARDSNQSTIETSAVHDPALPESGSEHTQARDPTPRDPSAQAGYVYVMVNASMQGLVKIGRTIDLPEDRAKELSAATGVPTPFQVVFEEYFEDSVQAEAFVHARLESQHYRVSANREFFSAPIKAAVSALMEAKASLSTNRARFTDDPSGSTEEGRNADSEETTARPAWEPLLELADAAQYGLGETIQDPKEALRLYRQAARMGSGKACLEAGKILGRQDHCEEALEFFKTGASRGVGECWAEMACIYAEMKHQENMAKCWAKYFQSDSFSHSVGYKRGHYGSMYVGHVKYHGCPFDHKTEILRIRDEVRDWAEEIVEHAKKNGASPSLCRAKGDLLFVLRMLYPELRGQARSGRISSFTSDGRAGVIIENNSRRLISFLIEDLIEYANEPSIGRDVEFDLVEAGENQRAVNVRVLPRKTSDELKVRIPGQIGQRFQFNSDTDSNSFRTGIPIQIGQGFRFEFGHLSGIPESCPKGMGLFTGRTGATLDKSAPSALFHNEKGNQSA
ncbi:MAG: S1 RNA-binding domain-containing protein, partial [Acidobacteria bacterium]|nr:S1 RNA-binding domain-containing protein [Acidobacteriota bacterium]